MFLYTLKSKTRALNFNLILENYTALKTETWSFSLFMKVLTLTTHTVVPRAKLHLGSAVRLSADTDSGTQQMTD